jgi:hypothetical protein
MICNLVPAAVTVQLNALAPAIAILNLEEDNTA